MKSKEELVKDAFKIANQTIPTTTTHIYVAFEKGKMLAEHYHADKDIVLVGLYLMDSKLKEAGKLGKKKEHTAMASEFAKSFLKDYNITQEEFDKIINCIEAHHGKVPYQSLEAEICANADCYRFIHPNGVFAYAGFLATKLDSLEERVQKLRSKLEEKHKIISLGQVKEDLEEDYQMFLKLFNKSLKDMEEKNNEK